MNQHVKASALAGAGPTTALPGGMRYSVRLIQPAEAEDLMRLTDDADLGTKAFKAKVRRFSATMAETLWELNGETVIVGRSGKVLDGRARLRACMASGHAFPAILVTGVDDSVLVTIDAHSRRTAADVLTIDGVERSRTVSSAWQAIATYVNAVPRDGWRYQGTNAIGTDEITALTRAHRDVIGESAEFVHALGLGRRFPATVALACHYLASLCDPQEASTFLREVAKADPAGSTPAALLRRRLEDPLSNSTFTYRMAVFSKAWRAFMTDEPVSYGEIEFRGKVERNGNLGDEAFPTFFGVPAGLRFDHEALARAQAPAPKVRGRRRYDMSGYAGITVEEVTVDPDMAEELLSHNGPNGINRPIRDGHARNLGRMMVTGNFLLNGKTLKVTRDGDLSDGQHRCRGAILEGCSFRTLIVRGLEPTAFATLDLGQRKSLGNRLSAGGDRSGNKVNSVCTMLWRLAKGRTGDEPTAKEAEALYLADKAAIDASVAFVKSCPKMRLNLDVSIAGALHKLFAEVDRGKADAFMSSLASGYGLGAGMPVALLREAFLEDTHRAVKVYKPPQKIRAVIRAWNVYVTGRKVRGIAFVEEIESGYPEIKGWA